MVIESILPPLSEDARLLTRALEASPGDDTIRLALADALDECGWHTVAAFARLQAECNRIVRQLAEELAVPARAVVEHLGEK